MSKIWDFWAERYERLWVQKYSLRPTREYIRRTCAWDGPLKALDIGCGTGELIRDLMQDNPAWDMTGLDFSKKMLAKSMERNPKARHLLMDIGDLGNIEGRFDRIFSTHSFPYCSNQAKVLEDMSCLLAEGGRACLVFASGDSLYDRAVLFFVKLTTGKARYPSDAEFRAMIRPFFEVEQMEIIRIKKFMPRIAAYTLRKGSHESTVDETQAAR